MCHGGAPEGGEPNPEKMGPEGWGPKRVGAPKGGAPKGGGPELYGPQRVQCSVSLRFACHRRPVKENDEKKKEWSLIWR